MTTLPSPALPTELPPFGGLSSPRGHLPLTAMDVRAEIVGLLATTTVRQTFANTLDEHLEATYIFPLPDRAGVTSLVAVLGGRQVVGVLKEREAARDEYDAAIAEGRRAALVEEDRPGRLHHQGRQPRAGRDAEVELVLTGPLPYDDGEATFRFPLVVAPRYVPGQPRRPPRPTNWPARSPPPPSPTACSAGSLPSWPSTRPTPRARPRPAPSCSRSSSRAAGWRRRSPGMSG